ncbi:hypothetical protein KBD87_00685 [Candidatus Saccharibacteria bacterium]|nr:hypothetical protein [Candidatus Saccharibacteria bacterium]
MKDLEKRIAALETRNKKVEADKAWETSWTRRIAIALLTYVIVCTYFAVVIHIDPWLNALVPVIGYLLSTVTISIVKKSWLRQR